MQRARRTGRSEGQALKGHSDIERLRGLLKKYRTLARLRARREEVEAGGGEWPEAERAVRRAAFRALAAEFPGALRELELPASALEGLADEVAGELAAAEAGRPVARLWMRVVMDYHELLGQALTAKLWLARRVGRHGAIGDDDLVALAEACGRELGRAEAEALHHPPGGRVVELVWDALAERYRLAPSALRSLYDRRMAGGSA